MSTPAWIGRAQRWLDENAARIWQEWLQTKHGQRWKQCQSSWHRKRGYNSPYEHGFSLPQYHHDLIEAVVAGDEETAKAIMLYEGKVNERSD